MAGVDDAEEVHALVENGIDAGVQFVIDDGVFDAGSTPVADVVGQEDFVGAALFVAVEVGLLRAVAGEVEDDEITRHACLDQPVQGTEDGLLRARPGNSDAVRKPGDAVGQDGDVGDRDAKARQRVGDLRESFLGPTRRMLSARAG